MSGYPHQAGWIDPGTSRENAERIEASGKASRLRDMVRTFFEMGGIATADDLAAKLGQPVRAVQPRVSELRSMGLLEPTGERGKGSGGGTANIWRWKQ